ncbi:Ribonuclease [Chlamydia trachomatis]|nr:Ribonuclease [Chlamydia trachomatis]
MKKNKRLPDYYITKREAREKGWEPSKGNLCDVLPGKAIGGDYFGNREGKLPKESGRKYFEADVNYDCGRRDAERMVFSNDGLVFISKDHYKSFEQK